MALLRISSQLSLPLHTLSSSSSQSIHNHSIHFPNKHYFHQRITSSRRRGICVGSANEDTTLQTEFNTVAAVESNITSEDDDNNDYDYDEQDPDPQDLEYVSQIKRVLELLKKNRDMIFSEVKLTVMIEDPREAERKRLIGIDDTDTPTREDLAAVLEEVNEGKIPRDRFALQMLAEEMVQWPNLEVEATKKGKRKSLYAKATDTGIDPEVAAKRLNID